MTETPCRANLPMFSALETDGYGLKAINDRRVGIFSRQEETPIKAAIFVISIALIFTILSYHILKL